MKNRVLSILTEMLLAFAMITGLTGCKDSKEPLTVAEFQKTMESYDAIVSDITEPMSEKYGYIEKAIAVTPKDALYGMEFYEMDTEENAIIFYNTFKAEIEHTKTKGDVELDIEINNYENYELSSKNSYDYISRIENTVLIIEAEEIYREEIDEYCEKLNY